MLSHIQISYFGSSAVEEDIGGFDISVNDIGLMQLIQAFEDIVGDLPNLLLRDSMLQSLSLFDAVLR